MYIRFVLALVLALVIHPVPTMAAGDASTLVLSRTCLGPLELGKDAKVSQESLQKLFPAYTVKYEIAQGDSPDFHYFEVVDKSGELLFAISSFIDDDDGATQHQKTTSPVPIQLLQVYSPTIPDAYGLRVGDHVKDIMKKRGKKLTFEAGHHDVTLGAEEICYSIQTGSDESPENFRLKDAIKGNWQIRSISWPDSAW